MIRRCYIYLGNKWSDKKWINQICYAVLRKDGKCIRGRGNMLVRFPGRGMGKTIILARLLRKIDKLYPYLPENRKILYVKSENKFMREATKSSLKTSFI
jgi:hypothetical protein